MRTIAIVDDIFPSILLQGAEGESTTRYVEFTFAQGWQNIISKKRAGIERLHPIDHMKTAASDDLAE